MGTRGFVGFKDDNGDIHGWYNHFDSYPDGLGQQVVTKLTGLSTHQIKEFFTMKLKLIDSEEHYQNHKDIMDKDWTENTTFNLLDGGEFYKDPLFCEYSYIYDIKANELLLFSGCGKKATPGYEGWRSGDYYNNLVGKIGFPTNSEKAIKKMLALYNGIDEEEDDSPKLLT